LYEAIRKISKIDKEKEDSLILLYRRWMIMKFEGNSISLVAG
jgi:hypothetical protein